MNMPPNPFDEILRWTREHRRDVFPDMLEILHNLQEGHPNKHEEAIGFLMSIAFAAGRDFERKAEKGASP